MRICQVMLSTGFGGAERYFVDLSLALARRGHAILAICQPGAMALDRLRGQAGISLATVRVIGPWDPFAARGLRRAMAAFAPEVVETHLARAASLAGRAAAALRVPAGARIHNYVKLKYYRHVRTFWPSTADQRDYLTQSGIAPGRIEVIPHFSAVRPVDSVPAPPSDAPIAALGRLVRKKGFDVLLVAAARLRAAGWKLEYRIGGDGPEREALAAQAAALGLDAHARLEGWQASAAEFLRGAAVFVLPSRDEPFGIVLLEAMACGVPIIATTTPGPREILDDATAWLIPPDDAPALAQALAAAMNHPEERAAKARAALQRLRARYAEDVVVPRVVRAYETLARR